MQADEIIRNKFAGGNTSQGGASDPAAISFYGHQKQIEDMMDAIEFNQRPLIDGPEGRKSVEIVLAIYESAKSGELIKLPY